VQDLDEMAGLSLKEYSRRQEYYQLKDKVLTETGLCAALNKLALWASVFAPNKTTMINKHLSTIQEYLQIGYPVSRLVQYSNAVR
jgi:hypothetical protein